MSFKPFISSLAISLLLLVLVCQVVHGTHKITTRSLRKYCGEELINMWSKCCNNNPDCENSKREVEVLLDSPNIANKFLWKSSGRRNSIMTKRGAGTDAVEECCAEGCSLSEIAEYSC
ncbi:hypothetical protein AC249_AIPGENE27580 [Exaiptasia diaphana]|nr:hypothetical protein AC249_AIPGENE27580 [Exaiptasia diaphana]